MTGFDIAEKAVAGDAAGAPQALRWAMIAGSRTWCSPMRWPKRCIPSPGWRRCPATRTGWLPSSACRPGRSKKAQEQARRWARASVAEALRLVAALNADVKGAAADPDYALSKRCRKIAELAAEA